MKQIKIVSIFVMTLMITTIFGMTSIVEADPITIDEEQTGHSQTLQMGRSPSSITMAVQGFKADKTYLTKVEVYFHSTTSDSVTVGIAKKTNGNYFTIEKATHRAGSVGWNLFDFNCMWNNPIENYYIIVTTSSTNAADLGYEIGEDPTPYEKNGANPYMSYYNGATGSWVDVTNADMAFKVYGYNNNERPNAPTLNSPANGHTFTIPLGQTLDVELKATTVDPDGDDIMYRFINEQNGNAIGDSIWVQSGQQGTVNWENLEPGTYRWYAKAWDWKYYGDQSQTFSFTIETDVVNEYDLNVNIEGQGTVTLNPPGGSYTEGTIVTLTPNAATDWKFDKWSGDIGGSQNPISITMNGNKDVTAHFIQENPNEYTLNVNIVGQGSVNLNPTGGTYVEGTVVTLTAIASDDWKFDEWSGDLSGTKNQKTIEMNGNKDVTAHFIQETTNYYMLIIEPSEGGNTNPPPGEYTYKEGTYVTVEAIPDRGWSFAGWVGTYMGPNNPLSFNIYQGTYMKPIFLIDGASLTADAGTYYVGGTDEPIVFSGTASGGTPPYKKWDWDFGDGSTGSGQATSHTYSEIAKKEDKFLYKVKLTVTDANDQTASDTVFAAIGKSYANKYALIVKGATEYNWDADSLDWAMDNMEMVFMNKGFDVIPLRVSNILTFKNKCQQIANTVDKDDLFVLVMMGHGTNDNNRYEFYLNGNDQYPCTGTEINSFISQIICRQVVILFSCHSGKAIPYLTNNDKDIKRIIITSSSADEVTYDTSDWMLELLRGLNGEEGTDLDNNGVITFEEINRRATMNMKLNDGESMHPLLDDNGDGVGHTIYDSEYHSIPVYGQDGFYAATTSLYYGLYSSTAHARFSYISKFLPMFLECIFDRFPLLQRILKL